MMLGIDCAAPLGDITVIQSPYCTHEKWNFRPSRYRSKRLQKKLIKRFGEQRTYVPVMLKMMHMGREVLVVHPDILKTMKEQFARRLDDGILGPLAGKNTESEPLTEFKLRQMALKTK